MYKKLNCKGVPGHLYTACLVQNRRMRLYSRHTRIVAVPRAYRDNLPTIYNLKEGILLTVIISNGDISCIAGVDAKKSEKTECERTGEKDEMGSFRKPRKKIDS